jgi:hypothetical protein
MLRRHVSTQHALNSDEYLKRWGLRSDHPLIAPAYSERRSTLAKALGLGRKPRAQATPEMSSPAAPTPVDVDLGSEAQPARRRSVLHRSLLISRVKRWQSRRPHGDGDPVQPRNPRRRIRNEAVAEPKSTKKRRRRSRVGLPQPEQTSQTVSRRWGFHGGTLLRANRDGSISPLRC